MKDLVWCQLKELYFIKDISQNFSLFQGTILSEIISGTKNNSDKPMSHAEKGGSMGSNLAWKKNLSEAKGAPKQGFIGQKLNSLPHSSMGKMFQHEQKGPKQGLIGQKFPTTFNYGSVPPWTISYNHAHTSIVAPFMLGVCFHIWERFEQVAEI